MSISVQEVNQEGLSKSYKVVVSKDLYNNKFNDNLVELQKKASVPGFRKGKAPLPILKRKYGSDVESETFKDVLNEGYKYLMTEYKITPATQPKVNVSESGIDKDFEFTVDLEESPNFDIPDFAEITVDRYKVDLTDDEIIDIITRIAERAKPMETVNDDNYKIHKGDVAIINFLGKINGEPFAGGAANAHSLAIGSGEFIPGFEDQLIGKKVGSNVDVNVTFPEDYHAADLKGKEAVFEVEIIEIKKPGKSYEINDDISEKLGFKPMALDEFKAFVKQDKEKTYANLAYDHSKLNLFDQLEKLFADIDLPTTLVAQEIESIKKQTPDSTEEEIMKLSRRRVALGLFLLKVAEDKKISYTEQDLRNLIFEKAKALPGFEMQVIELFNTNKALAEQLKNEVIENKTVNFIMDKVKINHIDITEKEFIEKV